MSMLNWNAFAEYHNKHEGASAILFGSGPTILEFNSGQVPSDVLRYGVNDQIFLDLNLDYWFMGDAMPQVPEKFYNRYKEYNEYKPNIQKFVRFQVWEDNRVIDVPPYGELPRSGQMPARMKHAKYYACDSDGNPDTCMFKKDITDGALIAVASISFEVLQFMLFSGIKKIYLVGHDCNYDKGTFAKIMIGKEQQAGYWIARYWGIVKGWIEENYPDVEIYSINPVSLNIFPTADQNNIG
jgi:hypothetical protein